jgi:hypothetical protein
MLDRWGNREIPVLRVLVDAFEDLNRTQMQPNEIAELSGLPQDDVNRALRALARASPPYIEVTWANELNYPWKVRSVTERARRAAGQWPNEEAIAERLVRELREAAEREPDKVKKTLLHRAADAMSEIGVTVIAEILAKLASGAV